MTWSPAPAESTKSTSTERGRSGRLRVLVGGIGYRYLRDGSVGIHAIERLADRASDAVEVEDVSYHPVGLSQNLHDRPPYDRVVLVAAAARGRAPGTVSAYRWDGVLPDADEIQTRVSEAVTGVISLDNTLIVCGALGGFPNDVRVVEVEPASEQWGEELSPEIEERLPEIVEAVWSSTRP
ncbi:MAG TPA: hydrogenase maturation protease [Solirubrobacterales bacterium]|nr:hydrogenase maturation protease [Solirubrobacterales bacterium]